MSGKAAAKRLVKIEAQPEQIEVDLAKTALVVVDMQNAFVGRGEDSTRYKEDKKACRSREGSDNQSCL